MPSDNDKTVPPDPSTEVAMLALPSFTPGTLFGRYRIEQKIGEGGMGAVYLALDTWLDRRVALKIPVFCGNRETAAERFQREAKAAAGLDHINICRIYDVGVVEHTHFLCMQFISGLTLADRLCGNQPLDPREAARIVRTVALAMQVAHAKGVIHRDLKPANIMLDDRGEPVVMDFGLAKRSGESGDKHLSIQGEMMGTPAYMPPEQLQGDVARMGPSSDIYSLGVVLYELLTGKVPFVGELFAIIAQIAMDAPKAPTLVNPDLDPKFDTVVLKAMAKRPEERWKNMQAMADTLAVLAGDAVPVRPSLSGNSSLFDAPNITFRVLGTQYAYKPPPGLPVISIGRQKRKAGESAEQGNDFVLRVAGNDALSARISRRHLEIHRQGQNFQIIDKSKTGVLRNGIPIPPGQLTPLADGDRLGIAGVVTLEVLIGNSGRSMPAHANAAVVAVPAPTGTGGGQVQIEASLGDMVTMEG